MLRISDVSYRYKTRKIPTLKHLSLHVTEGEMLLLAGRSGCGKSTLIKAVSGLLNTAGAGELDGKIYLNNKDTAEMTPIESVLYLQAKAQTSLQHITHIEKTA